MARNAAKGGHRARQNTRGKGKRKPQPAPQKIIQFAQSIFQSRREAA